MVVDWLKQPVRSDSASVPTSASELSSAVRMTGMAAALAIPSPCRISPTLELPRKHAISMKHTSANIHTTAAVGALQEAETTSPQTGRPPEFGALHPVFPTLAA